MNKPLRQRYQTAEERVEAAEAEVRRASESRFAELMKLPSPQRLRQIDDPLLTTQDRLKLRNSIEAKLDNRGPRGGVKFPWRWSFRSSRRLLRYVPRVAIIVAIIFPAGMLTYKAWKNTDEVVPLSQSIDFNWTLPDGTKERKVMRAGGNLAIKYKSDTSAIARRWIEGQGYATAEVNIQDH
jgi:hypothetical protein